MSAPRELLISADSHVIENRDLWVRNLPAALREDAPRYIGELVTQAHPGGHDPHLRIAEMEQDGVSAEILYPSLMLDQFAIPDAHLQEACFRVYNDWLSGYCSVAPDRLFGIGVLSAYNIGNAITELHRCKDMGFRGVMVWQVPPERLSFATDHYDRLWAAAEEAQMPVSLHILTGEPYKPGFAGKGPHRPREFMDIAVNQKLLYAMNTLRDFIVSGALDRFPRLKLVFVENEVSWMPFALSQYDKYWYRVFPEGSRKKLPSEYFREQIYSTFFNDSPSGWMWEKWGFDNCMWSNDFPHFNSTWPNSRAVITRDLGELTPEKRHKLIAGNVSRLYHLNGLL